MSKHANTDDLRDFIMQPKRESRGAHTAISLFSGAGLSDLGYEMAGFHFVVHVEEEQRRADIGADNFPSSQWLVGDVRTCRGDIVEAYPQATHDRLDFLAATPPCQGMSSSNPSRGKRQTAQAKSLEEKNRLILEVISLARSLKPRVIVAENVRQVLTLGVEYEGQEGRVIDLLAEGLSEYKVFPGVVNVADYGIPQVRRRALVVAVHKSEPWLERMMARNLLPWPRCTHAEQPTNGLLPWISVRAWFEAMDYERLDARSVETAHGSHELHFVPNYEKDRYLQVSQIPAYSGRSAYENDICPSCGLQHVPEGLVICPSCGGVMRNRPYVERNGRARLIKGFHSSYHRMNPQRPAYTVTTNSSHVGSDFKIHPWEHRVLSILECADLQTVPRFYDWSCAHRNRTKYLVRNLVGEAFPPYFTYLHGRLLADLLSAVEVPDERLAPMSKAAGTGTEV